MINCSVLADKRLFSGTTPVSCLLCAAAQFLKKAIPSHAVYDTKRLFSSYCSHALFYRAPANASFLLHSTAPFKMNPLHIVLTYLPLKDQMAISQTCTFVHDVAAYIYILNKNNSRLLLHSYNISNLSKWHKRAS